MLFILFSSCNFPIINPATIHPNVPKNLITGNDFPESDDISKNNIIRKSYSWHVGQRIN